MEVALRPALRRPRAPGTRRWWSLLFGLTLLLSIPLAAIVASLGQGWSDTWGHLTSTVLDDYVVNSLWLMLGVGLGTFIIGTGTAWLTATCDFPGRKIFEWALLLPLAMPAYIIAYTYAGMLDFAGPLQTALRETFDWGYGDYWFPEVRSLGGAIAMFTLVLYPYVYLITRAYFLRQSRTLLEVSRSLGLGPWQRFLRVALPTARPAIVAGMTLALMETLADYGTVQYFGVSTFTTGIFRTWFGMGDLTAAAQLSSMLLLFVATLVFVERYSRGRMRFHATTGAGTPLALVPLAGGRRWLASAACALPLLLGFVVPAAQLGTWALEVWRANVTLDFWRLALNSLGLAAGASALCLLVAVMLCFCRRLLHASAASAVLVRVASLGYAVPGTVVAIGVMIPFIAFDKALDQWFSDNLGMSTGLLLSGTLVALLFAYLVRFVSVSVQTLESGYANIRRSIDDSSRLFGCTPVQTWWRIHMPLLRPSLLAALLLVFVDVLKELPATLVLRPFNFNTLAVRAFELASDERLMDAALPALTIVLVGLLPVIYLSRQMARNYSGS